MGSTEICEFDATSDYRESDSLDKLHWWQKSSIYQVLIQSFQDTNGDGKGDLRGVVERLDYFVALGIDVIWISPIYASPMCDMGCVFYPGYDRGVGGALTDSRYDIADYRKINPIFGTMEDLELLVRETHQRGLKIILDIALNHTASTVQCRVCFHLFTEQ